MTQASRVTILHPAAKLPDQVVIGSGGYHVGFAKDGSFASTVDEAQFTSVIDSLMAERPALSVQMEGILRLLLAIQSRDKMLAVHEAPPQAITERCIVEATGAKLQEAPAYTLAEFDRAWVDYAVLRASKPTTPMPTWPSLSKSERDYQLRQARVALQKDAG